MSMKARDVRSDLWRAKMAPMQAAAQPQQNAPNEQRADDYEPPAATEQERLTKNRFDAHFAFYLNPPMQKRSRLDHFGMGAVSGQVHQP